MSKIFVIGNGPAGISAALYAVRSGMDVTVFGKGESALKKAHQIDNYYGIKNVKGDELFENGIEQAVELGVKFIEEEVVGLGYGESLLVSTAKEDYSADAVIIATGTSRNVPKIDGIKELEGKGISYCATCDGFFFRGKELGVLGSGEYAVHEATELLPIAKSVTIFTDGKELEVEPPKGIGINKSKITKIDGDMKVERIETIDGIISADGLFIAQGVAGSADLAKKVGAETDNNKIIVGEDMATNVPGLFAAGDCTGGMLQVSKAVYEGAKAATEAVKYVRAKNQP